MSGLFGLLIMTLSGSRISPDNLHQIIRDTIGDNYVRPFGRVVVNHY